MRSHRQGRSETSQVSLTPGQRGFVVPARLPSPMPSGVVQVRVHFAGTPDTDRVSVRVNLVPAVGQPLLFRRGPTTGNRLQPAASARFTRTERVHLEVPANAGETISAARLVDRTGKPFAIPLTRGERTDDATGQRWLTADVVLAPLAMGDYAIEIGLTTAGGERRSVAAFRIVP